MAVAGAVALAGCSGSQPSESDQALRQPITIALNLNDPAKSEGSLVIGDQTTPFQVGYGRHGVTCAGTRFEEGYTPLGRFKVNAILSNDQFVMDPALIKQSGKSEAELKATLFKNMNAIDFKGDGEVGEYGIGYISLAPIDSVKQPMPYSPTSPSPLKSMAFMFLNRVALSSASLLPDCLIRAGSITN